MTPEHFKEVWIEHVRKAEEDERNIQRRKDYDEKLANSQCSDDYSVRLKEDILR